MTASVSTHVPKPHTPFQWAAMDGEAEIARKQELLAARARALRVTLKMHENHASHIEGIFSRGDRRVADVLEAAFRLGCRFDSWDDALRIELWEQAIAETAARTGFDVGRYLGTLPGDGAAALGPHRHRPRAGLPGQGVPQGAQGSAVAAVREAVQEAAAPEQRRAAEAAAAAKLICYDCGIACDLGAMKEERLFYLRRMNAWQPSSAEGDARAPADGAAERIVASARQTDDAAEARGAGDAAPLPPALHQAGARRLPRPPRSRCATCRASSGAPGSSSFTRSGFHPKPELSFGPALGLGIPSLGELVDVKLVDDVAPDELLRRLARVTLDGIEFLEAARLGPADRAVGRRHRRGGVRGAAAGRRRRRGRPGRARRRQRSAARAAQSEKKIARTVDVRKTLLVAARLGRRRARAAGSTGPAARP